MSIEDENPDIRSHPPTKEESIFTKKGPEFEAVAEVMSTDSLIRLAELADHLNITVRTLVAENPLTPFFALFKLLADSDAGVRTQASYTLAKSHAEGKVDLTDKGLMTHILKYEKDNLKAIEAFEDLKSKLKPRKGTDKKR